MSQFMTLKQRRRHRELGDELNRLKPRLPPFDYETGKDPEKDETYQEIIERFNRIVEEMYEIEEAARRSH
ncbi:MAG: hypothetical protein ISP91_17795 [Pseudomonadales bacterium]|nr:hypothetical protein [Pseudomonadales bacterium]